MEDLQTRDSTTDFFGSRNRAWSFFFLSARETTMDQAVYETLLNVGNPDGTIRSAAEQRLKEFASSSPGKFTTTPLADCNTDTTAL